MTKFAQIQDNKAHWIFEADEHPEFHPDILLVDITGNDAIQEGWDYNPDTNTFSEPEPETVEIPNDVLLEQERTRYIQLIQEAQLLGESDEVKRLQAEWAARKAELSQ